MKTSNEKTTGKTVKATKNTTTAKALNGKALANYRKKLFANSTNGILKAERETQRKAESEKLKAYIQWFESLTDDEKKAEMEKTAKALPVENCIIDNESLVTMGNRIAIKALQTIYKQSGQPFIYRLYVGLIADITVNTQHATTGQKSITITDGYDIAQTAQIFLTEYRGKRLDDESGKKDKDGNPVSILRACFHAVNAYIMQERQKEYKKEYLEKLDENGVCTYLEIDNRTGATFESLKAIANIVKKLKLSTKEKQILKLRLQRKSRDDIAKLLAIPRGNVNTYIKRIENKVKDIYGVDDSTLKAVEKYYKNESKQRGKQAEKRNAKPTTTKAREFTEKTHAEKLYTLKRLYRKAKANGETEKAEKIKAYAVKLEKQHRQTQATAEKQTEIEKRIARLVKQANAPTI